MSQDAIDKGHEQFMSAMRASDAGALSVQLADDVTFCPPHERTRNGKADVEAWARELFGQFKTKHASVSNRDVVVAGDWAFEKGSFVWAVHPAAGGETTEDQGRYRKFRSESPLEHGETTGAGWENWKVG